MTEWREGIANLDYDEVFGKIVCVVLKLDTSQEYCVTKRVNSRLAFAGLVNTFIGYDNLHAKFCVLDTPDEQSDEKHEFEFMKVKKYKDVFPFIMVHDGEASLVSASYRDSLESHTFIASTKEGVIELWNEFCMRYTK